jgi:predicted enzyme related to lactoylglutathione lyase
MHQHPVVHFEMPYEDRDRMASFYEKVFGWQAQKLGPEMGSYVVVSTTETDPATQRPKEPGAINGGFFKRAPDNAAPSVVIAVPDIRAVMKKVTDAGGRVLGGDPQKPGEPGDIPGVGLYCRFVDTEGNVNSLLEPKGM